MVRIGDRRSSFYFCSMGNTMNQCLKKWYTGVQADSKNSVTIIKMYYICIHCFPEMHMRQSLTTKFVVLTELKNV